VELRVAGRRRQPVLGEQVAVVQIYRGIAAVTCGVDVDDLDVLAYRPLPQLAGAAPPARAGHEPRFPGHLAHDLVDDRIVELRFQAGVESIDAEAPEGGREGARRRLHAVRRKAGSRGLADRRPGLVVHHSNPSEITIKYTTILGATLPGAPGQAFRATTATPVHPVCPGSGLNGATTHFLLRLEPAEDGRKILPAGVPRQATGGAAASRTIAPSKEDRPWPYALAPPKS